MLAGGLCMKMDLADTLKEVVANPNLLDRMGSADLKRVGKALSKTLINIGNRAGAAEEAWQQALIRLLEMTGGQPPTWSYLHREEALRMHLFTGFEVIQDDHAWVTCGCESGSVLHPIYEFDFEEFGPAGAETRARNMLVHLRQSFTPRPSTPKELPHV